MRILQLSTYDRAGGAEKVALNLHHAYRERGHEARLLVKYKWINEVGVAEVDPYGYAMPWAPICHVLERATRGLPNFRGQYRLVESWRRMAYPQRWLDYWCGIEDFNYPYAQRLLDDLAWSPDVIHAHNLHGGYFDLRALSRLGWRVPFVWTLHDTWAFTGHCGQFIDCERWRTGCGNCPDLDRPPAIRRDRTAENWQRKREIYAGSRLAIATPSRWMMSNVERSMLRSAWTRVIPNGVDLTIFKPSFRQQARDRLGLPQDAFVCMFIAYKGSSVSPYKDFATIAQAVRIAAAQTALMDLFFVCVGGSRQSSTDARVLYTGTVADPHQVALHYQAADILLHAADAENFPLVILEALACGTPVVATAVGGIPEQIVDGETGFLVPRGDSHAMAQRIVAMANQPALFQQMSQAAARQAQRAFGLDRQAAAYLQWFDELTAEYQMEPR